MSKRIYISGKISGLPIDKVNQKFKMAERQIFSLGGYPVNPTVMNPSNTKDWTWNDYMVYDINLLLNCHAIFMLKDGGQSKGARIEYAIAKELGLEILFQE